MRLSLRSRVLVPPLLLSALSVSATLLAMRGAKPTPAPLPAQNATIAVNPGTGYQTMRGWEAVAYAAQDASPAFASYAPAVFDLVAEAGINRVRLAVRAGVENPSDAYGAWKAAGYPVTGPGYATWRATRYQTVNDNGDPNTIDSSRFHFTELDDTVERVVNPLRSRLAARGESLYVNLNYVAFAAQNKAGEYFHHATPEYAEFMLATFRHLQQKHGWVPDAIEVILEPDNVPQWRDGGLIGRAIVATGRKLAAHGFRPEFIAPSATCIDHGLTYFDQMMEVAEVRTYLKEIAYHRYCNATAENLDRIARRAEKYKLSTSMLEWWDGRNSYKTLHEDLKLGRNSAWQQATLAGLDKPTGLGITTVDLSNSAQPKVAWTTTTRFTSLYYKYVRLGARRVGATSSASAFDPLAFVNTNGTYTVVVNALNGGSFVVTGLPAGRYGIVYATEAETTRGVEQTIAAGGSVSASIPATGVLTVYGVPTPTKQ